jgi:hypothetical protein
MQADPLTFFLGSGDPARKPIHRARVARWRTSDQKLRWCAAALLQLEPRLRRIKGGDQLPLLQAALRSKLHLATPTAA